MVSHPAYFRALTFRGRLFFFWNSLNLMKEKCSKTQVSDVKGRLALQDPHPA
jgi:hypothetical protein